MDGLILEMQDAIVEIEDKLKKNSELSHKDLLTLLAQSLIEEESN